MTPTSCFPFRLACGLGLLLLVTLCPCLATAEDSNSHHVCDETCRSSTREPRPRHDSTCCNSSHDRHQRAGHPQTVAWYAKPSFHRHATAGYVGGGAAWRGEPRAADEGTWGRDYAGVLFKKHIWLNWLHGHREPRGEGSYATDGPHLLHH